MKSASRIHFFMPSLFVFLFLFLSAAVSVLSPGGVLASESMPHAMNSAGEETATFEEDEPAVFDSESEAEISPVLHPEAYQPAVYFPGRLSRSVVSNPWIRGLAFAVLAMLALAVAGFFGRRRYKLDVAGDRGVFEKFVGIAIGAFLITFVTAGVTQAQRGSFGGRFPQGNFPQRGGFQPQIYTSVEDGVSSMLGEDREIYQTDINITADVKQVLSGKLGWTPSDSSIKVYYSKAGNGAVEAYAFVLTEILARCGGTHKYCIKVSSAGQVEGVQILELNCHHSFGINSEWFLDQFEALNVSNADSTRIDAVTRATMSSDLTYDVVRRALALFEVLEGNANA